MIISLNGREDLLNADDSCPLGPLLDELRRHLTRERMVILRTDLDGEPLDEARAAELADTPIGMFDRLDLSMERLEDFALQVVGNLQAAVANVLDGARHTVDALGDGDDATGGDASPDAGDDDEDARADETPDQRRQRGIHYLSMVVRDTAQVLNTLAQLAQAMDANFNQVNDGEGTLLQFANTLTGILRAINDAVSKDDYGTARSLLDRAFQSELGRLPNFLAIIGNDIERVRTEAAEQAEQADDDSDAGDDDDSEQDDAFPTNGEAT